MDREFCIFEKSKVRKQIMSITFNLRFMYNVAIEDYVGVAITRKNRGAM